MLMDDHSNHNLDWGSCETPEIISYSAWNTEPTIKEHMKLMAYWSYVSFMCEKFIVQGENVLLA